MRKKLPDSIKTMLIILVLITGTDLFEQLPWWSFVLPVLVLGVIAGLRHWQFSGFITGFIPGFIIWSGANSYFDLRLHGGVLNKLGVLINFPEIVVIIIAGLIGGVLTGLVLYTGKCLSGREKPTDINSPIVI